MHASALYKTPVLERILRSTRGKMQLKVSLPE
jgi:hypothetical protein